MMAGPRNLAPIGQNYHNLQQTHAEARCRIPKPQPVDRAASFDGAAACAAARDKTDDLVIDILLRLPPDDTACLTRASLVCKSWRRLVSDRAFHRRYREIHGAPPFLGFLYNNYSVGGISPFFVPTTPASPFSQQDSAGSPTRCQTLDCHHGRVLLHHPGYTSCLTVWNPVTGLQRCISAPVPPLAAAVLCASASNGGCDHLDCSDGPFIVVLLAEKRDEDVAMPVAQAQAQGAFHHYSSETGKWSVSFSFDINSYQVRAATPSLFAGGALFFLLASGRILKCDYTNSAMSAIRVPQLHPVQKQNLILCTVEGGGLGVASVVSGSLRLVAGRTNPDGVTEWVQCRQIELDSLIPNGCVWYRVPKLCVVGSAEGTGYIFVRANDSIFSVEVKSGRTRKIGSGKFGPIFPFACFYIPDLVSARQAGSANEIE